MRSTWLRPLPGGIVSRTRPSKNSAPTRLPPRESSCATVAATSVSTRCLRRSIGPKSIEADVSSSSHAVTSRSSTYSRTWVMSVRAVTFQSMWRRSSPYWYSRRSATSTPVPRNTVR